jgi:hypothetical protein
MSTDLRYLAYTAILTAGLWIPYIGTLSFALGFVAVAGIFWQVVK